MSSLQVRFYEQVDRVPERRAVAFYGVRGLEASWSFEELYDRAAAASRQLAAHGLQRGDVCIIVRSSDAEAVTAIVAVLLLGAVPLLVAPPVVKGSFLDLPRILEHTIRRTGARLVLCESSVEDMRAELEQSDTSARFVFGNDILRAGEEAGGATPPRVLPAATDVGAMQLTSGTTGTPRVCAWSQQGILAALDGMQAAMKLTPADQCFNWTPLYHDMGLVNNFLLCLTTGVPLVLCSPHEFVKRPVLWLRGLSETQSTVTWSPNFGFAITAQRVRDAQLDGVRLDHVRAFWNAAERIHLETIESFYERFAPYGVAYEALKTNFGCAENVGGATFSDVDGPIVVEHVDRHRLHQERIAVVVSDDGNGTETIPIVSAGRPHPTLDVTILSPEGEPLPDGHVGEVTLETPSRLLEYKGNPEATRQAFVGSRLRTGDLGYTRDGHLFWVGRVQERMAVRGKKYDPSDFESVLFDVDGLREGCFVAFGVDDETAGTQQIVIISEVREPLTRTLDELRTEITRLVFMRLGVTVQTVEFVRPGTLTKTSSGKRRHRHFRELYQSGALDPYLVSEAAFEQPSAS